MANVLERIIEQKRLDVEALYQRFPESDIQHELGKSDRDFDHALRTNTPSFIFECKKASPSKGLIRADFDPVEIAQTYAKYASCISVLTDEHFFQGRFDFLPLVRNNAPQPVLCKDFFIDPHQVRVARYFGADAILLMLSVLDDETYKTLHSIADEYAMDVLTEVSTEEEMHRALALNAKIIGINNRNLRDLSTDIDRTKELRQLAPAEQLIISESGIYTREQITELNAHADGYLVGSSLMSQDNLDESCRQLKFGLNKVCGLTREKDVQLAYQAGALYGGLIFVAASPRCITLDQAKALVQAAPLKFVGVFRDDSPEHVATYAETLSLDAVQLHGQETLEYMAQLRPLLPEGCAIWKAYGIEGDHLPEMSSLADKWVLDTQKKGQSGGTGESFNWQLLNHVDRKRVVLAGGLNADNIQDAVRINTYALDINSGVEDAPGQKSEEKLMQTFNRIREVSHV